MDRRFAWQVGTKLAQTARWPGGPIGGNDMNRRYRVAIFAAAAALMPSATAAAHDTAPKAPTPKAYIVSEIEIKDEAAYAAYAPRVLPVLRAFGGRYLARGGSVVPLEGKSPARRVVIIEFASLAKARAFWDSPGYREIVTMRHQAAESRVFIVEGSAGVPTME
jgi:uncharacterized protein (DUF1330 family)